MLLIICLIGIFADASYAQLTRGAIVGTVSDSNGALIAGARISVTNMDTNISRETVSNDAGFYRAPALEPGRYTVKIEQKGFQSIQISDVTVRTTQETTYNPVLKVSGVVIQIEVSGNAESGLLLDKTAPTIGLTTSGRQVTDLPINAARTVSNLALLSPNAFTAPGSTGMSFNGQRARNNNFTIDGSDNNDIGVTLQTSFVIPEAVKEFQVQTNAFSVEFGRNSGGQLNIITKSGTNQFHGEAFEYYRGRALNARDSSEERANLTRPPAFNRNQVGGVIGGPIVKDKLFFFGGLQADRTRQAPQLGPNINIPTRSGFAALSGVPLRRARTLTDGTVIPAQTPASRQAILDSISFLNDVYATNPTFTNVRNICFNGTGTTCAGGSFVEFGATNIGIAQPQNFWNWLGKVDYNIGKSDNVNVRYLYDKPFTTNVASNTQFGSLFAGNSLVLDQNLGISETHIFSPTITNEFRFSYIRRNLQFPENDPISPATAITGFFNLGGASNFPQSRIQNSFQFSDTMSWLIGQHSIKFGTDIRKISLLNEAAFDSKGTFTFNNPVSFLNNEAFTYVQALQTSTFDARQTQQYYFFQDDIRLTRNLTLGAGLRYELAGVPFGFFGATDPQVLASIVPGPVKQDKNNFAPGIGFAYSPNIENGILGKLFGNGRTSIRGGYRINYDILFYNILTVNASNFPRVVVPRVDNPRDVFPSKLPVSGTPVFNPLASFVNTPEDSQMPMGQTFSLTIQRQIQNDIVLEFGYAGSRGSSLINQLQANPAILTPAQIATVQTTRNDGSIPSTQLRRVNPTVGPRVLIATTAQSTYHSGFVSMTKRFTKGLQFTSAYTFSKNMSNNDESLGVGAITAGSPQIPQDFSNINSEKSLSVFDRTHRFVASWVYEIPWFKSRALGNPVFNHLFSGWQINGVYSKQSGQPFTILTGVDTNGNGSAGDRVMFNPNGVFSPDPVTGDLRSFTNPLLTGRYFVPVIGANGLPIANSIGNGNVGRNTLRGQGFQNWDMGLIKRIKILESKELSLRVDAFNIFNQKYFGNPTNSMSNPQFGGNFNNGGNRSLTLGAKFKF